MVTTRRGMLRTSVAALGVAVLGAEPVGALARRDNRHFVVDRYRRLVDTDATPSFRRAIHAAQKAGGGRVLASPGRVYRVSPQTTYDALNPSGDVARYRVCLQLPSNVTLDMRGSTLRLEGGVEAALIANDDLSGMGARNADVGLVDAVLDGGGIPSQATSLLHMAYVARLALRRVKIVRGTYQGGWIFNCHDSVFDGLDADGFQGSPWSLGSPIGNGNEIHDSRFGALRARNVTGLDGESHVGNSFVLVLDRCSVRSIEAQRCAAGVKVQWPSRNVTIERVHVAECGDAAQNSGLKLQGDVQGGPVTRIAVGEVVAQRQTGTGLFMEHSVDCTVTTYRGLHNDAAGSRADVWIGGTNDRIESLHSDRSGGPGVMVRPYATGYELANVLVKDPGQSRQAPASAALTIYGGSGKLGDVRCKGTETPPTMGRGVDVNGPSAVGSVGTLKVTGQSDVPFVSASAAFHSPPNAAR